MKNGIFPMIKASLVFKSQDSFLENSIFQTKELVGRKSDFLKYVFLKNELEKLKIDLGTPDINNPNESDLIINIDHVHFKTTKNCNKNIIEYLILTETPSANQEGWMIQNHVKFKKIFTYNKDIVDNVKYFYIPYSIRVKQNLAYKIDEKCFNERNLLVMVANPANHYGRNLLYQYRIEVLNWYNHNKPNSLNVYGTRWYNYYEKHFQKKLGTLSFFIAPFVLESIIKLYLKKFKKVIKGSAKANAKRETLEKYKFVICFENEEGPTGNITEKIFDCFEALTIPIYLGPTNISEFIPKDCFIDFRKYKTIDELDDYISNMEFEEYKQYITAIQNFISSEQFKIFDYNFFTDTIISHVKKDIYDNG